MAKKTLGYVELEWTCPQCGTRNAGTQEMCTSCGKAQPKKVEFHQAAEEELITDEQEIARAQAGPDVHCAFCGARNPAGAERCARCGAHLTSAEARESGRVLGAHLTEEAQPIQCPQCGWMNEGTALKCDKCNSALPRAPQPQPKAPAPKAAVPAAASGKPKKKLGMLAILGIGGGALIALAICVVIVLSLIPTKETVGVVQTVSWERTIDIEELGDVTREGWADRIPSDGRVVGCVQKHRDTQDQPAPNATEVCGTPYTVDTGTGHGKVVQDCVYHVYDDWCQYTVTEWRRVSTAVLTGSDLNPRWPGLTLAGNQREGERGQSFEVVLAAGNETYTLNTDDDAEFAQFRPGTRWTLTINALGGIRSIEPAR